MQLAAAEPIAPLDGDAAAAISGAVEAKAAPLTADKARSDLLVDRQKPVLLGDRQPKEAPPKAADTALPGLASGCSKASAAAPIGAVSKAQGPVAAKVGEAC
jgi:hypothetical protein